MTPIVGLADNGRMRSPLRRSLLLGLLLLGVSARRAAAVDVTQCGQTVPPGETAVLLNDLNCAVTQGFCGVDGPACTTNAECPSGFCYFYGIRISRGGSLDLSGFTIDGVNAAIVGAGVFCDGRCELRGPGAVTGFPDGVTGGTRCSIRAEDLTVSGNSGSGIGESTATLRLRNVTASGNGTGGVSGRNVVVDGVTANDNGIIGVFGTRIRGHNLTANDNAGGPGVRAFTSMRVTNLTALNNAGFGVWAGGARLDASTVTGSQLQDIATTRRPRLTSTTCGTSARMDGNQIVGTWGVCTND